MLSDCVTCWRSELSLPDHGMCQRCSDALEIANLKLEISELKKRCLPDHLQYLVDELHSQDNRMTSDPVFQVRENKDGSFRVVQSFFTNREAERFIKLNQYDYQYLHVYVASGHKNQEWKAMRNWLLSLKMTDRDRR